MPDTPVIADDAPNERRAGRAKTYKRLVGRALAFAFGVAAYGAFLVTFLYTIGFVADAIVPKTINRGETATIAQALVTDLLLLANFALQHSGMARQPFKRWLIRFVPASIERSTYVLASSLVLILLLWRWQPIPAVIFEVQEPILAGFLRGVSLSGWFIVLLSTFLINHFELFGLQHVWGNLIARKPKLQQFRTPLLYRFVRHPIYLGFIVAFWATPMMTVGHLLFAMMTTAYILVGIRFEERDLTALYGEDYRKYQRQVRRLIPIPRRSE